MKNLLFYIVISFASITSTAQTDLVKFKEPVEKEAKKMFDAFQNKDYNTFLELTHPKIISLSGGKKKMEEMLKKGIAPNVEILNTEIYKVSEIIELNNTLQCSMKQKQIMNINGQKIYTLGSLIGISYDDGEKWVFIGVASKTLDKIRIHFPELSKDLDVSPQTKPILIN